jgi:Ca2+/Na+ antiporter
MGLITAFELLLVLSVIGLLMILKVRLRINAYTTLLLVIIAFLFLAMISLGRITMNLLGSTIFLGILLTLLTVQRQKQNRACSESN